MWIFGIWEEFLKIVLLLFCFQNQNISHTFWKVSILIFTKIILINKNRKQSPFSTHKDTDIQKKVNFTADFAMLNHDSLSNFSEFVSILDTICKQPVGLNNEGQVEASVCSRPAVRRPPAIVSPPLLFSSSPPLPASSSAPSLLFWGEKTKTPWEKEQQGTKRNQRKELS